MYYLKLPGRVTTDSNQLFQHTEIHDCKEIINIFSYSWVVQAQHLSVGIKICETKLYDRACFVKTQMSHKICCLASQVVGDIFQKLFPYKITIKINTKCSKSRFISLIDFWFEMTSTGKFI